MTTEKLEVMSPENPRWDEFADATPSHQTGTGLNDQYFWLVIVQENDAYDKLTMGLCTNDIGSVGGWEREGAGYVAVAR